MIMAAPIDHNYINSGPRGGMRQCPVSKSYRFISIRQIFHRTSALHLMLRTLNTTHLQWRVILVAGIVALQGPLLTSLDNRCQPP